MDHLAHVNLVDTCNRVLRDHWTTEAAKAAKKGRHVDAFKLACEARRYASSPPRLFSEIKK